MKIDKIIINNFYNDFSTLYTQVYEHNEKGLLDNADVKQAFTNKLDACLNKNKVFFSKYTLEKASDFENVIQTHFDLILHGLYKPESKDLIGFSSLTIDNIDFTNINDHEFAFLCGINPFLIRNISYMQTYTIIKYFVEYFSNVYIMYLAVHEIVKKTRKVLQQANLPIKYCSITASSVTSSRCFNAKNNRDIAKNDQIALSLLKNYFCKILFECKKLIVYQYDQI